MPGVVTASIATWFVENLRRAEREVSEEVEDVSEEVEEVSEDVEEVSEDVEATRVQLAEVLAELRTISARLDALEHSGGPTTRPDRDRSVPSARPSA